MANIFLENDEIFPLAASNSSIFGRAGGNETLQIFEGVTDIQTDANIESLELAGDLASHRFEASGNGLEISINGTVVATLPSLNQELDLRASDGNVRIEQTGLGEFTARNPDDAADEQPIGPGGPVQLTISAGSQVGRVPDTGGSGTGGGLVQLADVSSVDAGNDAFVFTDSEAGATADAVLTDIENFGADDEIQITGATAAEIDIQSSNGNSEIEFTNDAGTVFRITLLGVTGSFFDDVNLFNERSDLGEIVIA